MKYDILQGSRLHIVESLNILSKIGWMPAGDITPTGEKLSAGGISHISEPEYILMVQLPEKED